MDKIVYLVVTKSGGIDGRDSSDPGGQIRYASFDKGRAKINVDAWSTLESRIIDVAEATETALAKLDPIDRLILGI
jgi:hypothetical protein